MSAGWPGRAEDPMQEPELDAPAPDSPALGARTPLGPFDSTIIHRARAINADALRVIDDLLDQIADSGRR